MEGGQRGDETIDAASPRLPAPLPASGPSGIMLMSSLCQGEGEWLQAKHLEE